MTEQDARMGLSCFDEKCAKAYLGIRKRAKQREEAVARGASQYELDCLLRESGRQLVADSHDYFMSSYKPAQL